MTSKQKLAIYESRFEIKDGVIHCRLISKIFTKLVCIGWVESAYMRAVNKNWKKDIKTLRKQLIKCNYYVEGK